MNADGFDPMALLGDNVPLPTPWESLAQQARWLAEYAERVAAMEPSARYDDDEPLDHLAGLDERALAVRSLTAACRRDTYRALLDQGWTVKKIADHWGVSDKAIYKILGRS